MVGGGLQSFMGPIHREAIAKAGNVKLARGCFGSTRQSSMECQAEFGTEPGGTWGAYREFLRHEVSAEHALEFFGRHGFECCGIKQRSRLLSHVGAKVVVVPGDLVL